MNMQTDVMETGRLVSGVGLSVWRTIAVTLIGAVVAGAGYWVTIGREKIDRAEAIEIVQTYSPYVRDKAAVDELRTTVNRLVDVTSTLSVEVAKLRVQIDASRH